MNLHLFNLVLVWTSYTKDWPMYVVSNTHAILPSYPNFGDFNYFIIILAEFLTRFLIMKHFSLYKILGYVICWLFSILLKKVPNNYFYPFHKQLTKAAFYNKQKTQSNPNWIGSYRIWFSNHTDWMVKEQNWRDCIRSLNLI